MEKMQEANGKCTLYKIVKVTLKKEKEENLEKMINMTGKILIFQEKMYTKTAHFPVDILDDDFLRD